MTLEENEEPRGQYAQYHQPHLMYYLDIIIIYFYHKLLILTWYAISYFFFATSRSLGSNQFEEV